MSENPPLHTKVVTVDLGNAPGTEEAPSTWTEITNAPGLHKLPVNKIQYFTFNYF